MSSFDYRWMLSLYLWPQAKLLSCPSYSNLLLNFVTVTQTHKTQRHMRYENKKCIHVVLCSHGAQKHTLHSTFCLSHDTFLSVLSAASFQSKESQLSHERRNFHTFHLLLSSLPLTHSALSLLIALVPSARLIDQKASECSSTFA